jgi:DNA helicase MCM8
MRQECTRTDALEVIEIMKVSMVDYYSDEMGELDFSRSMNGSGGSKSSMVCL